MPRTEIHPLPWFRDHLTKLDRHIDPEKDRELTESIKAHGILQPPGALPDGTAVFGRRRVRCGLAAGLKETLFYILDKPMSEDEVKILELTENIDRQDFTDPELYLRIKDLWARNPTWQRQDLAAKIHKSASMLTRILCIDDLIPEAREAFLAGQFGFSKAYAISKAKSEQGQRDMLAAIRTGASRDEAEHHRRRGHGAAASTIRMKRVKIAMPQGASVVVSGKELSMADLVELLSETLKQARKAADQYDVKTWVRMMADQAKAR